jgi:hypothetical protein
MQANKAILQSYLVEDLITEGDKVVWRWSLRGKHTIHDGNQMPQP